MFCRDIQLVSFAIQFRRKVNNKITSSGFDLASQPFQIFKTPNPDLFIPCCLTSAKYTIFSDENRVLQIKMHRTISQGRLPLGKGHCYFPFNL